MTMPEPASRVAHSSRPNVVRAGAHLLSRRKVLYTMATAVSAGCGARVSSDRQAKVSVVKAPAYDQSLYETVRRILTAHRLDVRGKRVVIKPNLVEFTAGAPINTHPLLVHAAFEAFRALGAAEVRIAEGPGHRRITWDLAEAAGYFDVMPDFERHFTDLNLDEISKIAIAKPFSKLNSLYLPHTVLNADLLVSLPKVKTHHWVGATLGMKNLFGVVPGAVYGWPKNVLHWAGIDECVADLYNTFPRLFCLADGIEGMEGNGPIQGTPKHVGVLVAGADLAAVDASCCRIMGIDPAKVRYLTLVGSHRIQESNIRQIGEPLRTVSVPFRLIPQFAYLRGRRLDATQSRL